jgi:hypothetical protein
MPSGALGWVFATRGRFAGHWAAVAIRRKILIADYRDRWRKYVKGLLVIADDITSEATRAWRRLLRSEASECRAW